MKAILKLGLAVVPVLLCLLYSCKDSDNVKPLPTADFYIYEPPALLDFPDLWVTYDTDTTCGRDVEFKVANPFLGAEYHWRIGAGEYEGERLVLGVGDLKDYSMDATLTVSFTLEEYPDSIFTTSKTRTFFILDSCATKSYPKTGSYRGYMEGNPKEVYDISLVMDSVYEGGGGTFDYKSVTNLTNTGCTRQCINSCRGAADGSFRQLSLQMVNTEDDACFDFYGRFYAPSPDRLEVLFFEQYLGDDGHVKTVSHLFIGTRVHQ